MKVLVACEFSGVVRDAFRKAGHDAWSCDVIYPETISDFHIFKDCRRVLADGWDMLIAHPPCTYLSNAGISWLRKGRQINEERWSLMEESANFFLELLFAPIDRICVENPIMHKYASTCVGRSYTQIIHPWQHGHGETKPTCLWLRNLPRLKPTCVVTKRRRRLHYLPETPDRWMERSRTYSGIAEAMAAQWGSL